MSRTQEVLVLGCGVALLVGALHLALYFPLIRLLAPRYRRAALGVLVVLGAGLCATLLIGRLYPVAALRAPLFPFAVWLGAVLLFAPALAALEVVRGGLWAAQRLARGKRANPDHLDPERRDFLIRSATGLAIGGVTGATTLGVAATMGEWAVREVEVPLARLPLALDGFTIVQITDLHLGPVRGGEWLAKVVAAVNALQPDLIAITGDLVDGSVAQLGEELDCLRTLSAPCGVFFVTGNHEYYGDADGWLETLAGLGVWTLRNERVSIGLADGPSFDLAGVDDFDAKGMLEGHAPDLPKACLGRDPNRELVLLAHQPRAIEEAAKHGVGLQLSGHTHGGQFWPLGFFFSLQCPYVRGLYKHDQTWVYVSSGTGFWGYPIRLGSRPEIGRITLRSLDDTN